MNSTSPMLTIDTVRTRSLLPFATLIPALCDAFKSPAHIPQRHHHHIPQTDGTTATLLLMPAWQDGGFLGVKVVTVYPGNGVRGLPGLYSTYILSDASTGQPLAILDGNEITGRRTAGISALAASYLSREDASTLLIVGAGRIARLLPEAFSTVRPIKRVEVWNRDLAKASALVIQFQEEGLDALVASSLEESVRRADIVSCATLSTRPLVCGEWLRPGTHLDLIGSFTPSMREADDHAILNASVFVDTFAAVKESGDLLQPIAGGMMTEDAIRGDLADLCTGRVARRQSAREITVFKAVGTALSDIAAATLAYRMFAGTSKD